MKDWKDALTHRHPAWPVANFAPGNYLGKCTRCDGDFMNMDKRAVHCFPCAVEAVVADNSAMRARIRGLEAENETLRNAIRIVSAPLPSQEAGE